MKGLGLNSCLICCCALWAITGLNAKLKETLLNQQVVSHPICSGTNELRWDASTSKPYIFFICTRCIFFQLCNLASLSPVGSANILSHVQEVPEDSLSTCSSCWHPPPLHIAHTSIAYTLGISSAPGRSFFWHLRTKPARSCLCLASMFPDQRPTAWCLQSGRNNCSCWTEWFKL